ncbi:MAG: hypothetical protein IH933_00535 [Euryarchaeota archaeon]|nr:hypothetical protein [Euryarchaeota archaeon]
MKLFGSRVGTAVWVLIGLGTAGFALQWENPVTGVIAVGWIVLAVFSYLEYRKTG